MLLREQVSKEFQDKQTFLNVKKSEQACHCIFMCLCACVHVCMSVFVRKKDRESTHTVHVRAFPRCCGTGAGQRTSVQRRVTVSEAAGVVAPMQASRQRRERAESGRQRRGTLQTYLV